MKPITVYTARRFGGMHNDQPVAFGLTLRGEFCLGCQALDVDLLTPLDRDGCETGAFLCYTCSATKLPRLDFPPHLRLTWPATITAQDIEGLWSDARAKKAKQERSVPRREAVRTTPQDLSERLKVALVESAHLVFGGEVSHG